MCKESVMSRPETPYEAASYDLNQFRERRMAERRAAPRNGMDRRAQLRGSDRRRTPQPVVLPPVSE
jgi:hypothetical protein